MKKSKLLTLLSAAFIGAMLFFSPPAAQAQTCTNHLHRVTVSGASCHAEGYPSIAYFARWYQGMQRLVDGHGVQYLICTIPLSYENNSTALTVDSTGIFLTSVASPSFPGPYSTNYYAVDTNGNTTASSYLSGAGPFGAGSVVYANVTGANPLGTTSFLSNGFYGDPVPQLNFRVMMPEGWTLREVWVRFVTTP